MRILILLVVGLFSFSCSQNQRLEGTSVPADTTIKKTSIVILGTIQDAGSPHIACDKACCEGLFEHPDPSRRVISLGLIDTETDKAFLFEATPDIGNQMKALTRLENKLDRELIDGIFLTHAHIGHYAGLMFLGKEAMNANQVPVFVMPGMNQFLSENGPWDQLVTGRNIVLNEMENERPVKLSGTVQVTPLLVPHRDEYSETVGYRIQGPSKTALFIPDIDKWEKWDKDILEEIRKVDYAFLDATFYSGEEIGNRDISEIPHPFIIESLEKFGTLSPEDRAKVVFIHFNHTNPVIEPESEEGRTVEKLGFKIGRINSVFEL